MSNIYNDIKGGFMRGDEMLLLLLRMDNIIKDAKLFINIDSFRKR